MKNQKQTQQKESGQCFCRGAGPQLTELFCRMGPPPQARAHFETARLEFLKGLRAMLDARIEQCSKRGAKGQKIDVE